MVIDFQKNPYAHPGDKDEIKAGLHHRLRVVKKFIGREIGNLHTLDIGESNRFSRTLGVRHNTVGDLNYGVVSDSTDYDVITCFEVIEHVMNPLGLMVDIFNRLRPGGVCYLSTPVATPLYGFLTSKQHFTEYRPDRMETLFRYVGFDIVRYKKFVLWDWWFMFWGVRPILRVLFQRNQLWEIRKP